MSEEHEDAYILLSVLAVCYLMHQVLQLQQDAQLLLCNCLTAVQLLQQAFHYLHTTSDFSELD